MPWFRAFEVLGPGEPPVPLTVLPLESVLPPAPPAPLEEAAPLPPELVPDGACAKVVLPASKSRIVAANSLMVRSRCRGISIATGIKRSSLIFCATNHGEVQTVPFALEHMWSGRGCIGTAGDRVDPMLKDGTGETLPALRHGLDGA